LALRDVSRALELRPDTAAMLAERAMIYRAEGRPDAALGDLNLALAIDPRNRELLHSRAWLLLAHLRLVDQALADARKLVRLAPRSSDAWQTYGSVLLWGKSDSTAAGEVFERAVSLGPDDTNAWFGYGQALYSARNGRSLDAFDTYADLCARGARCQESVRAWLRRFVHDPSTYAEWPRILFKWRLLAEVLL
jgi:tetratricopeptide (TPR) repeat protein